MLTVPLAEPPHWPKSLACASSLSMAAPSRVRPFWTWRSWARESHAPPDHAYVCQPNVIFPGVEPVVDQYRAELGSSSRSASASCTGEPAARYSWSAERHRVWASVGRPSASAPLVSAIRASASSSR